MFNLRLLFIFLLIGSPTFSQTTFSISGTVSDKSETLPGAGVYVSGYQIATVTNTDGKFILPNLKPGSYDIIVQMVGYLPFSKNVIVTDKSVVVNLKLAENTTLLKEVVIRPDPNRAFYLDLFKQFFIGNTPNAAQCKILNTNILVINDDPTTKTLTVSASDFLIIENQALGYRIKYLLAQFEYNFAKKILFYAGYPTFEEMKGSKSKQIEWQKNREIAYNGSSQHFFTALYQNKITEEGFIVNKRVSEINKNRLPDSVINANIKRISASKKELNFSEVDSVSKRSLQDWFNEQKKEKTYVTINRTDIPLDTLVKKFNANLKMINFSEELFISYKNEQESPGYKKSFDFQSRPKELENYQVSVIKMLESPISFYSYGITTDPNSTLYSGYWSYEKMADSMPIDYLSR